jgi:hypothetical protein
MDVVSRSVASDDGKLLSGVCPEGDVRAEAELLLAFRVALELRYGLSEVCFGGITTGLV